MTTPQEMKERYMSLYDYMAQSRDPKNMKAFGCVMTEMSFLIVCFMNWLDKCNLNGRFVNRPYYLVNSNSLCF